MDYYILNNSLVNDVIKILGSNCLKQSTRPKNQMII